VSPRSRLLAGFHATGGRADLAEHLRLWGPPPRPGGAEFIAAIEAAGLTGRGGAAFPTARKLRTVAAARKRAVVVANGGEGEPTSAKDRALLTLAPHLVLDGAGLAADAVGADEINVCVHDEETADLLRRAVAEREAAGLQWTPVRVHRMPGHYVASEETALVRWLDGGPALPTFTPPRPFEKGVAGRPTLVDNVETLAHTALIARYGPQWFRSAGAPDAPGTALFTTDGAVNRPGVYELPLGTPLTEVLRAAGGPSRELQAVLAGGYGGGWLAPAALGTPATQARLAAQGAALGPGIIVALPAGTCGIAETAAILGWLADQNAGQCGPCMFGLPAIADDFAALTHRPGGHRIRQRLERRLGVLPGRGACRHPDGAVRLARSALRVFAGHLERHETGSGCFTATAVSMFPLPHRDPQAAERSAS
jgi:NADH:ubiquinone oxidoreductase subunit F (NADH-binding)